MRNKRFFLIRWVLLLSYIIIFYVSLLLTIRLRHGRFLGGASLKQHLAAFTVVYVLWLALFYLHNLFEVQTLRRFRTLALNLVSAMFFCLVTTVAYFYFQPGLILTPRRILLLHIGLTGLLVLLWQLVVKQIINHAFITKFYLFAAQPKADDLAAELRRYDYLGMRFGGLLTSQDLPAISFQGPVSIALPDMVEVPADVMRQFYSMRRRNITYYNYQTLYEDLTRKIYLQSLNEAWFLANISYQQKRFYQFSKRCLDVLAGFVGLAVFALTYPLVTLLITLSSPGPVLFRQPRVGQYGTIFTVNKYRTMKSGGVHDTWTAVSDPRITRVGKILRRLRLDELPQCLNLLEGTMSLVGPRPEQPQIVEMMRQLIPFYDERHLVKPGLTGWGQLNVYARSLEETKTKLQYDLYYIKHRSLGFDLEIVVKTIYHVLTNGNT